MSAPTLLVTPSFFWPAKTRLSPVPVTKLTTRASKIAHVRYLQELRLDGDIETLLSFMLPDCEMHLGGASRNSPFSGHFAGHDEIREKLTSLRHVFSDLEFWNVSEMVDGDDVALRFRCQTTGPDAGPSGWVEGMAVVRLSGDKIAYYGTFLDTAALSSLIQRRLMASKV